MQFYELTMQSQNMVTGRASGALCCNDGIDIDRLELLADVRSGDYLASLATSLDIVSQLLLSANHAERDNLQKIVNDLLYLSERYRLVPKD